MWMAWPHSPQVYLFSAEGAPSSAARRGEISGTSNPSALKARFIAVVGQHEIRRGTSGALNRAFSARLGLGTIPRALP